MSIINLNDISVNNLNVDNLNIDVDLSGNLFIKGDVSANLITGAGQQLAINSGITSNCLRVVNVSDQTYESSASLPILIQKTNYIWTNYINTFIQITADNVAQEYLCEPNAVLQPFHNVTTGIFTSLYIPINNVSAYLECDSASDIGKQFLVSFVNDSDNPSILTNVITLVAPGSNVLISTQFFRLIDISPIGGNSNVGNVFINDVTQMERYPGNMAPGFNRFQTPLLYCPKSLITSFNGTKVYNKVVIDNINLLSTNNGGGPIVLKLWQKDSFGTDNWGVVKYWQIGSSFTASFKQEDFIVEIQSLARDYIFSIYKNGGTQQNMTINMGLHIE